MFLRLVKSQFDDFFLHKKICGAGFIYFFCGNDVEKFFNHQVEEEDEATSKAVNDDDSEEVPGFRACGFIFLSCWLFARQS